MYEPLKASKSPFKRPRHAPLEERNDLAAEDLALHFQKERFGFGQGQAQLLQMRVVLAQHDEFIDGDLLVVVGGDHELKLEV